MYNWRSESITDLCRILARLSISHGFVRILALPGLEKISRFYNRGQNSLTKPNTNRTKTTSLLLPPTPSPYAMTTEHRQPKNHTLTVSPFIILPQLLLPPPLPLMQCWCGKRCLPGNCSWPKRQHWVRGGGGGGGGFGSLVVYKWTRLEGKFFYRFCPRQTRCPNYW